MQRKFFLPEKFVASTPAVIGTGEITWSADRCLSKSLLVSIAQTQSAQQQISVLTEDYRFEVTGGCPADLRVGNAIEIWAPLAQVMLTGSVVVQVLKHTRLKISSKALRTCV